ncbi:MAG: hypothetical protein WA966_11305 [Ornithinimicrobium sp.]
MQSVDSRRWILADADASEDNPRKSLEPQKILEAVHGVGRILLILDACFAGSGADEAFPLARKTLQEAKPLGATDLCILSAAQRLVPARPNALARALAAALIAQVRPSLDRQFLNMEDVEASLAKRFAATEQVPQIVRGKQVGSRMLPNPGYMPPPPPRWDRMPLLGVSATARGLSDRRDRGWFFTGRDLALAELWEYVHTAPKERRGPYLLTGPSGSGTSALLVRMVTTATSADRAELPLVTRPAADQAEDVAAMLVSCTGRTTEDVVGLAESFDGHLLLLDDVDEAAEPDAVVDWVAAEADRRVVVVRRDTIPTSDPRFAGCTDLASFGHNIAADSLAYLRLRLAVIGAQPSDHEVELLASASGGVFAAVVAAADAWARAERQAGHPLQAALRAATKRLHTARVQTLRRAGVGSRPAQTAVDMLDAVSSWDEESGVPLEMWARVSGCPAELLRAAAPRLGARPADGENGWAFPQRLAPRGASIAVQLLDAVNFDNTTWADAPPAVMCALLGAATAFPEDDALAGLLADELFLLACPPSAVTRTIQRDGVPGALRRAWGRVPGVGQHGRASALRLALAEEGVRPLPAINGTGLSVVAAARSALNAEAYAQEQFRGGGLADSVRSAALHTQQGLLIVTAQDDAEVVMRSGPGLRDTRLLGRPFQRAVTGLAVVFAGGAGDAVSIVAVSADEGVWMLPPEGGWQRLPALRAATAEAAGPVMIALRRPGGVDLIDGAGEVHLSRTIPDVDHSLIAMAPNGPVLWYASSRDRLRRRSLPTGLTDDVGALPGLRVLGAGCDGDVVAIHRAGFTRYDARGGPSWSMALVPQGPVRHCIGSGHHAFLAGGSDSSYWVTHHGLDSPPTEPFLTGDYVVALHPGTRPDQVVVVGRRRIAVLEAAPLSVTDTEEVPP